MIGQVFQSSITPLLINEQYRTTLQKTQDTDLFQVDVKRHDRSTLFVPSFAEDMLTILQYGVHDLDGRARGLLLRKFYLNAQLCGLSRRISSENTNPVFHMRRRIVQPCGQSQRKI